MRLRGASLAVGVAILLVAVAGSPASAAGARTPVSAAAASGTTVRPAIGCFYGVGFTETGPVSVSVDGFVSCFESVDSVFVNVQLNRNGFPVASGTCGGASSVDCDAGVPCVPGSYQGFAQFWLYSTSGNAEVTTAQTPVKNIAC